MGAVCCCCCCCCGLMGGLSSPIVCCFWVSLVQMSESIGCCRCKLADELEAASVPLPPVAQLPGGVEVGDTISDKWLGVNIWPDIESDLTGSAG